MSRKWLFVPLLLALGLVLADDAPETQPAAPAEEAQPQDAARPQTEEPEAPAEKQEGPKLISGMSILGNQEAPKSLVIVPWKSSQIGDAVGISTMLDDSTQPVDREEFLRALRYYEIRLEMTP